KKPQELAQLIAESLKSRLKSELSEVTIAGPGFINIKLSDSAVLSEIKRKPDQPLVDQSVVVEFSDPNPFKILHAGHLYTSIVGDAIANLLANGGAKVHRVNYGGDVGLHVAKSLFAMLAYLGGENPGKLDEIDPSKRSEWMSEMYVAGNKTYEEDESKKGEITELNRRIYEIHSSNDHDSALAQVYWTTRGWSYDQFDNFYSNLNIHFEKFYPESEVAPIGLNIVSEQLEKGVFKLSDGAVIFDGEQYGLHTRVFINSQGLPTYECKEIGLAELKRRDYNFDRSIIITGSEQQQYMAVVLKALEQFAPDLSNKTLHLTHGMVRLAGGKKMSSRSGNILTADEVLSVAKEAASKVSSDNNEQVVLAAVKYSFLKQRIGGDVVYEPEESVNVLGNSGPYLQYAHARARSILAKAKNTNPKSDSDLETGERQLALKLSRYASQINTALSELSPHLLCNYLYDLAQEFNRFYEANRVLGDEREAIRLYLTKVYAERLKEGLNLLGIVAPEHL
ncbi:MAG: arginine--tRNA ligase, partial [Candidatus Saccharimonadales bacterium]